MSCIKLQSCMSCIELQNECEITWIAWAVALRLAQWKSNLRWVIWSVLSLAELHMLQELCEMHELYWDVLICMSCVKLHELCWVVWVVLSCMSCVRCVQLHWFHNSDPEERGRSQVWGKCPNNPFYESSPNILHFHQNFHIELEYHWTYELIFFLSVCNLWQKNKHDTVSKSLSLLTNIWLSKTNF